MEAPTMRVKLGSVAVESRETYKGSHSGAPIVGLEHLAPEDVNLTAWDVDSESTFTKRFSKGQVLFGRRRAYLKKAAVAPCDGICSGDITVIAAKSDKLAPELLPFVIQNDRFFDFAVEKSAGSLSPRAKWEHLREFEFDLPPIDEQRRLSEVLWAFDDTKQAYKRLIKLTDELVKSRVVEMFGDILTNDKGWVIKPIKDFAIVKIGPFGSLLHAEDYVENGIPLVNPSHIIDGEIVADPKLTLTLEKYQAMAAYALQEGDVVLGRRGEIGRCAVVDSSEYLCGTGSMLIRIERDYLPMMLQKIISSDAMRRVLEDKAVGVTMMNLNAGMIANLEIIVPPLSLQNRFADFAAAADKSKFELTRALDELDAAYKALVRERLG
jgi:type I restriction enzyme S subunit